MKPFKRNRIQVNSVEIYLIYYKDFIPTDYLHFLSEREQVRLSTFTHLKRKQEFVSTRILKHELFGHREINYDESGAPYIYKEGFISISHSTGCSGIALNEDFKIGLDLEPYSSKAKKISSKFLNDFELSNLKLKDEKDFTAAWSCKEALYKLAGRKKIIFKTELLLLSREQNLWECQIINPNETIYVTLKSIFTDSLIITVNLSEARYETIK